MYQNATGVYRPRQPRASPLWRCAHGHFGEFLGAYEDRYQAEYGILRGRGLLPEERARMLLGWRHSGFSVHRGRVVEAGDGEGLEKLARYILRNPFSVAMMRLTGPDGTVFDQSRMNPKARANFVTFKPADFLAAVTQHIPDGGFHLVRYYGWYSNKIRGQRARRAGHARNGDGADAPEPPSRASAHWQLLIRKVYDADPLLCPDCGAGEGDFRN